MSQKNIMTSLNFFLKQVDPSLVATKYLSDELKVPKSKVKFDNPVITMDLEVGTSPESEIYEIKDKNGELIRIITTDHKNWSQVSTTNSLQSYKCHHCFIDYTNQYLVLPVKIERSIDGKLIIHGTGTFCCFECAYANLKTKWYAGVYMKNYLYSDSETLLRFLYYSLTGKTNLKASPEWLLHQKHGGKLTDKDFYSTKTTYIPLPNVILSTLKTMYIASPK